MCKHCEGKVACIPIGSKLKLIKQDNDYGLIELIHSCNKKDFKPFLRVEITIGNKISRLKLEVQYCPMCGKKL